LDVSGPSPSRIDGEFSFSGGILQGELTTAGNTTWSGGEMQGVVLLNVGTMTLTSGAGFRDFSLRNSGIVHDGTGLHGDGPMGASVENMAGGLYDLQADLNPPTLFTNAGTLRKSGGSGTVTFHHFTNLGGTIDVRSGTLAVDGKMLAEGQGPAWTGGNFQVAPGASLDWIGENTFVRYNVTGKYTGSGGGVIHLGTDIHDIFTVGLQGATFDFPSGMLQWVNGRVDGGAAGLTNLGSMTLAW
jgi:hypothetical protein